MASAEYHREYRQLNADKLKAYGKEYSKKYKRLNKDSLSEYQKDYREKNRIRLLNNAKKRREENPDKVKSKLLEWYYGITIEDYNNLFVKQNGKCAICGKHQSELKKKLSVDHNHDTNKVRGLLCPECNFGLGKFKDNKQLLISASQYLTRFDDQT